jgi:hypothetical protein
MLPIYKAEVECGLQEKLAIAHIKGNCLVCADATVPQSTKDYLQYDIAKIERAFGQSKEYFDLFPIYSILVTTGWNKNDDVFGRLETWQARSTPEDKPFNLEHDPSKIIGHIIASCPVDDQLNVIPNNTLVDDLPTKFHLLTSSVIYRPASSNSNNPEWTEQVNQIIDEIKANQWLVSMECIFNDFGYGMSTTEGSQRLVERTEGTAFLTKHLRAYGGEGSYNNMKLGRHLKNIAFSGKGLTRKPANPESIIITDIQPFKEIFSKANLLEDTSGVNNNNKGEINMTDFEKENAELKTQVAELTDKLNKVNAQETEKKIEELTASVNEKEQKVNEINTVLASKDTEITTLKAEIETLKSAKAEVEQKLGDAEKSLNDISIAMKKKTRCAAVAEYDVVEADIEKIVDQFISMADDEFTAMLNMIGKKKVAEAATDDKKKMEDAKKGGDKTCASEVLEDVKIEKPEIPANTDNDVVNKVEETRASISQYFNTILNPKAKKE